MRPDTRSFSFTWMKGSQKTTHQHQKLEGNNDDESKKQVQQTSSKGEGQPSKSFNPTTGDTKSNKEGGVDGYSWGVQRGNSGSRLRRLSNSLVRLRGGRYSNMSNDMEDENKWHKISEEPLSLDEDGYEEDAQGDEIRMDVQMEQPDVVAMTTASAQMKSLPVPVPFQPRENNDNNVVGGAGVAESSGLSLTKRLNKTVQGVKASLGNFSQRFRKSTRRRYRMPSTPGSAASPAARKILGRTPTKLYSPFGIETPITMKTPKRLADRPSTPRLTRKSMIASLAYSPSNNFRRDLDEARRGMQDFQILSRDITRRSVRF